MKRFITDLKKYWKYIIYSTKAELKVEIINSYLGWIWLVLEPLAFMLIYAFIAGIIFKSSVPYFPVFIFVGQTLWNFFNKVVVQSVKLVANNRDTVTKVYLPKFVLLMVKMGVNIFKMMVSYLIVFILMIFYQVPLSWNILYMIPITLLTILITFGFSCIIMHFGVFIEDLVNLTNIVLKFVFYLTGIFYDLSSRIHNNLYRFILLEVNPIANLIYNLRRVMIYSLPPASCSLIIWFFLGLGISYLGIKTIYKYENTYVKVIK